jgi:hypothetical protein
MKSVLAADLLGMSEAEIIKSIKGLFQNKMMCQRKVQFEASAKNMDAEQRQFQPMRLN